MLNQFFRLFDALNAKLGQVLAYLMATMVLFGCLIVILRYGFNTGSVKLEEAMHYMHATLFMLGAAYCQQRNMHVRLDIFYTKFSRRGQALVNLLGNLLLLLPLSIWLFVFSWDYVANSWDHLEQSADPGGLPFLYLLKTLLLLMPLLLFLQTASQSRRFYLEHIKEPKQPAGRSK